MKTISQLFDSAFAVKEKRNWEKIFVIVDIHETILEPTWSEKVSETYYPMAKECLQILTKREDVCLIQWSSSSYVNNLAYDDKFCNDEIFFNYINENPEVPSTFYADFDTKLYMNVIIDDKAGFEPRDWHELYGYLTLVNPENKEIKVEF